MINYTQLKYLHWGPFIYNAILLPLSGVNNNVLAKMMFSLIVIAFSSVQNIGTNIIQLLALQIQLISSFVVIREMLGMGWGEVGK